MVIKQFMKDVYFDFGCFASILSVVVESYPKETFGFLGALPILISHAIHS